MLNTLCIIVLYTYNNINIIIVLYIYNNIKIIIVLYIYNSTKITCLTYSKLMLFGNCKHGYIWRNQGVWIIVIDSLHCNIHYRTNIVEKLYISLWMKWLIIMSRFIFKFISLYSLRERHLLIVVLTSHTTEQFITS